LSQPFFPGSTQGLNLVLSNPYNFPISVTSVTVTVDPATTTKSGGKANPSCVGNDNLQVTRQLASAVTLPSNATKSLSDLGVADSDLPQVKMLDLDTNQDACKDTTFKLSYTGTATKS
jgi:hypothetical protein